MIFPKKWIFLELEFSQKRIPKKMNCLQKNPIFPPKKIVFAQISFFLRNRRFAPIFPKKMAKIPPKIAPLRGDFPQKKWKSHFWGKFSLKKTLDGGLERKRGGGAKKEMRRLTSKCFSKVLKKHVGQYRTLSCTHGNNICLKLCTIIAAKPRFVWPPKHTRDLSLSDKACPTRYTDIYNIYIYMTFWWAV